MTSSIRTNPTSDRVLHDRAVAVVAMAGRFPGASSVAQLWRNLLDRVESIRTFSRRELEQAGVAAALLDDPDYVPAKGMLEHIEHFDERFFDYSLREAALLDPQHRLLLEASWHALEVAIGDPGKYRGAAGVFASTGMSTYLVELASDPRLRDEVGLYDLFLHNAPDYLATRVAYKAGLRGPALTVQTGCSSSLVALHLACQSLLSGECDVALAGGVTARAPQVRGYLYDAGSVLSRDGHCRPFDADASGTVPGEAVAVVALKRLEDALHEGDHIHAVVLGSAINNDGDRKVGYTAPSVDGQCNAIAEALDVAGVAPRDVGYVEAHGTGTRLGDPLELAALKKAFGARGLARRQCAVGSIKSNLGHVDAAAGITGFIKAALAVEHGQLPATLHFRTPNPEAQLEDSPFFVSAETLPWSAEVRVAGVSSFGIGGTNAHAVLGRAPEIGGSLAVQVPAGADLILLSARSEAALERRSAALVAQLEPGASKPDDVRSEERHLAELAYTSRLYKGFEVRRAVIASSSAQFSASLRATDPAVVHQGERRPRAVAFLFPGGGTQYPGMGRELYEVSPVFRRAIDECAAISEQQLGLDLRALMYPRSAQAAEVAEEELRRPRYSVPAVWMTSYAMAQVLAAHGVTPQWMIGHSLGEYVAACLSGVLSVRDALTLATYRTLLFDRAEPGASLHISLGEAELRALLAEHGGVDLGVINTPESFVVSGPVVAIAAFERALLERQLSFKRLNLEAAVHSSLMAPLMEDVTRFARQLPIGALRIPYYSNLEGRLISPADLTADYWARHLRHTVRFSDNVTSLLARRGLVVLEVGPGTSLAAAVAAHLSEDSDAVVVSTMRHPRDPRGDREVLLHGLGTAWAQGVELDWTPLDPEGRRRVAFPAYPFEATRHWREAASPASVTGGDERPVASGPLAGVEPALAAARSSAAGGLLGRLASPRLVLPGRYRGDALAHQIAEAWAEHLGVTSLGEISNFFALGGTSLVAVRLMAKLQRKLQPTRRLFPDEILRNPELGALVEHLRPSCSPGAAELAGTESAPGRQAATSIIPVVSANSPPSGAFAPSPPSVDPGERFVVPLRPAASVAPVAALPLVLVHPAGGHVFHYRWLATALPDPARSVYGLVAPGLAAGSAPLATIEALAEHHLARLAEAGLLERPLALAGSSLGGCIAFEMAQRLRGAGSPVAFLGMLDTPAPDELPRFDDHVDYVEYLFGDMWRVQLSQAALRGLPERERIPHALRILATAGVELGFEADSAQRIFEVFLASERAMRAYRPRRYDGGAVYFRAQVRRERDPSEPERGWRRYFQGGLSLEIVPGDHLSMHEPPHVFELAARLGAHLASLDELSPRRGAAAAALTPSS